MTASPTQAPAGLGRRLKLGVLRASRLLGLFAVARQLTRNQVRILCYHGGNIGDESSFNPKLFVSKALVESRIEWLRRQGFTPVALEDLVARPAASRSAPLPVVITVDDGWFSSKSAVIDPFLDAGFPVALYLATRAAARQEPIIDVTVRYILWKAQGRTITVTGHEAIPDGRYDLANAPARALLLRAAMDWLGKASNEPGAAEQKLQDFAGLLGMDTEGLGLASRRFSYLNRDELRALSRSGCAIELHGHVHRYPLGDPAALAEDINACRDQILAWGMPMPSHYCYPSGSFDAHAPQLLDGLGVRTATTCEAGLATPEHHSDYFLLPRFLDGGSIDALEFEAEMSGFQPLLRQLATAFHLKR